MHEGQYEVSSDLVHRLLVAQFPQWSEFELRPVASAGTDNALFRLGNEMVVRMPIVEWAVPDVEKEQTWLPRLAPFLPTAIPIPLAMGEPDGAYPYRWSIYRWCSGANPIVGQLTRPVELASDVAGFLAALRNIDTAGAPLAGRGLPLAHRDESTRSAISSLSVTIDTREITAAWESALELPVWEGAYPWIHGDLSGGNILTLDGRLNAVIDFGALGVGDPAVDLIIAWNLFPAEVRPEFRSQTGVDEATWKRGRAWALSIALIQLPYYFQTNLPLAANARYVIGEALADFRQQQG